MNSRGRVIGGRSAINVGFYKFANPANVRHAIWDGDTLNRSSPWVEKVFAHVDLISILGHFFLQWFHL